MISRSRQVSVLVLAVLAAAPSLARAAATPQKVVTIEGITEYRLDNGLRVLLFPDPSAANVTVNLTVLVGSRHEGYGETGMAHLLEHMAFKGTPQHPNVPKVLKEHGARFNGTTWLDRTNYYETMPGTDANLEFGLRLEADRLVNSFIRREDLMSEMTVVRNEFEMGENSPEYVLSQRMMAVAYEWHNYGKSTIGNRSDIERVPIDKLQAFYRKYYQPDNAVLVVAGKFEESKALGDIGKYFGALKRPTRPLDATYTDEPPQDGERTVVLRRVGKIGVVGAIYHIPAAAHEDFAAVEVLNNVLVSEPAGRLYKALVESKKATEVSGGAMGLHDPGVLEISAQVDKSKKLEDVRNELIGALEQLSQHPFSKEEVERAKRQLLKSRELQMTDSNRIGVALSDWAAKGDWRLFFLHRDRLEKVTPQDVARVADRYLRQSNRTVGMYVPIDKPQQVAVPEAPAVAKLVENYKGRTAVAAGEVFDPTPANIEKRVQRRQLPGGLKLALLPKKTRGQAVHARLTLHFGSESTLKGHTTAAELLGPLMGRGTKKHDRQQLQDELDKLGARVSPGSSVGQLSFSIQTKRGSLPAVLRLVGEMLREPLFPANEFDILKREQRDQFEKGLTEPMELASREIQRRLSPYPPDNVRYTPTIEEEIARLDAVTLDEVRRLYEEQVGATVGELAVVGDFDAPQVARLAEELLSGWKAAVPFQRIAHSANLEVKGVKHNMLTPDKKNAIFLAAHSLALTLTDPDYAALKIGNYALGGGPLSSRLANRVRQKEGLSYGIASQFQADARDKSAQLFIFAISNPQNIDKVDRAIAEELDKFLKGGVDAAELAEAQKSYLQQEKVRRANDGMLAAMLVTGLFYDRTFEHQSNLEKKIAALTPDAVNTAVRKHFTPQRLVIIRAGDFGKP